MKKQLDAVKLFHKAFQLGYSEHPQPQLSHEKIRLRFALMEEENREYLQAATQNDIIGIADALGDMLYILCGTIIEHGLHDKIEDVFEEIQRSNMSKLGDDLQPVYRDDGKVLKGPAYSKPDLSKILL